jgi:NitT/TauT family transport system permease protein
MSALELQAQGNDVRPHERSLLLHEERRYAHHRRSLALRVFALRAGILAGFLVLWSAASGRLIDNLFVSDPLSVARSFLRISLDGTLWWHLRITLVEMTLGYILGVALGVGLAIIVAQIWRAEQIVRPLMLGVFAIPKVALAPLVIVWFGIYLLPKVILAASLVLFIVYFSTLAGFAAVNRDLIASVRVMGASRAALFLKLILPSAAPYIFSAMRITLPGALIGAIIGEFVSSNRGVGFLIAYASSRYDTAQVFAAILSLLIFGLILNTIVSRFESYVARWRSQEPQWSRR